MRFRDYLRKVDPHTAQGPDRLCRVCSRTVVILIALSFWWYFWIFICERTFHQGFHTRCSLQNYLDLHLVLWTEDVLHEELASFWKWIFNRCKSFFGKWCFMRFRNRLRKVDRHTFQGPDSFSKDRTVEFVLICLFSWRYILVASLICKSTFFQIF